MQHLRQRRVQFQRRSPGDPQRPRAIRTFAAEGFRGVQHHAGAGAPGLVGEPGVPATGLARGGNHCAIQFNRNRVGVQPLVLEGVRSVQHLCLLGSGRKGSQLREPKASGSALQCSVHQAGAAREEIRPRVADGDQEAAEAG